MASLLEKVSTLISANLHALVDQALKANSMAVIDQYIRQVEDHLEDLEDAAATIGGEIKSIKRKLDEHVEKAADLQVAGIGERAPDRLAAAILDQQRAVAVAPYLDGVVGAAGDQTRAAAADAHAGRTRPADM